MSCRSAGRSCLYSYWVRWDRSNSLSCSFRSLIMSRICCFWMPSSYSSPSTSLKWFKQVAWNTTHRSLWGFGQWSLHPQVLLTRGFKKLLQYSQQRTGNCSFFNICRTIVNGNTILQTAKTLHYHSDAQDQNLCASAIHWKDALDLRPEWRSLLFDDISWTQFSKSESRASLEVSVNRKSHSSETSVGLGVVNQIIA